SNISLFSAMKNVLFNVLAVLAVAVVVYLPGPSPAKPSFSTTLPELTSDPVALQQAIDAREAALTLKPDAAARILWADTSKKITEFSLLYLHGFSGTWHDGSPAIEEVARRLGANLYLTRLHAHGLRSNEPLLDYNPDSVYADAVRALAVAKRLGKKVVVVGTSTGATLGLMLAARFPGDVYSVINWSPNIRLHHPMSFLSNNPWGLQLTRIVVGGNYRETVMQNPERERYWYMKYRIEGIVQLQELLESSMTTETFAAIKQPVLTMCWYANDSDQDSLVSVSAMRTMHNELGSARKKLIPLNAAAHEIGYGAESKAVAQVVEQSVAWVREK
ncbi:MAG: alpha/beta hydrolase, partial [Candidatus Kapaibacterium sp.]